MATANIEVSETPLVLYALRRADDALILGHRLSEWCGHAPAMEEDMALANMGLDLLGQARELYSYAAKVEGRGNDEDKFAYLRDVRQYRNLLLVEQPNGDFAQTLARQFLYSTYQLLLMEALSGSADAGIADIAARCVPDLAHHVRFTTEWMVRLGDGACLNHKRIIKSLDYMWHFVEELFIMDEIDNALLRKGVAADKAALRPEYDASISAVLREAGLRLPEGKRAVINGRKGHDGHHVAHMLHDMNIPPHDSREQPW